MEELQRANKITAYWEGEGVAVGIFYKTHDKITTVKSTDENVVAAGFAMPVDTDENKTTAAQKLDTFKVFIAANAATFGVVYDPIDRRADEFKFPGSYTKDTIVAFAQKMLTTSVEKVLTSIQSNVVDKMVKAENLPAGSAVQYGHGEANVVVGEEYANGNLKYATIEFPVTIAIGDNQTDTTVYVDLVSGQLKKPRKIGETVLTMSGVKAMLVEAKVLPKIEKPVVVAEEVEADVEQGA